MECDFYNKLDCKQDVIYVITEEKDNFIKTYITNVKDDIFFHKIVVNINEDGCDLWKDKWDLIEAMDR
jgi:hypothetical protein